MPSARRFPPPWSVEETDACFIVRDANGEGAGLCLLRTTLRFAGCDKVVVLVLRMRQ